LFTLLPARDLSVTAVNPASGEAAAPAALRISFSYSDRVDLVQMLIISFQVQHLTTDRNNALQKGGKLLEITQRKAGESLDVLDPPSMPITPVTPDRPMIAAVGLGIGLLPGAIMLLVRRPQVPALQPA
jgi:hypothetical protein